MSTLQVWERAHLTIWLPPGNHPMHVPPDAPLQTNDNRNFRLASAPVTRDLQPWIARGGAWVMDSWDRLAAAADYQRMKAALRAGEGQGCQRREDERQREILQRKQERSERRAARRAARRLEARVRDAERRRRRKLQLIWKAQMALVSDAEMLRREPLEQLMEAVDSFEKECDPQVATLLGGFS